MVMQLYNLLLQQQMLQSRNSAPQAPEERPPESDEVRAERVRNLELLHRFQAALPAANSSVNESGYQPAFETNDAQLLKLLRTHIIWTGNYAPAPDEIVELACPYYVVGARWGRQKNTVELLGLPAVDKRADPDKSFGVNPLACFTVVSKDYDQFLRKREAVVSETMSAAHETLNNDVLSLSASSPEATSIVMQFKRQSVRSMQLTPSVLRGVFDVEALTAYANLSESGPTDQELQSFAVQGHLDELARTFEPYGRVDWPAAPES